MHPNVNEFLNIRTIKYIKLRLKQNINDVKEYSNKNKIIA